MSVSAVELVGDGVVCEGPQGGRHYESVEVDGRVWTRGDPFYVLDRHHVPRPVKFMYHYTGTGAFTCFSTQRFRLPGGGPSIPSGFVDLVRLGGLEVLANELSVTMSPLELRVRQTAGDLIDAGLETEANALLETLQGDVADIEQAENAARELIDAVGDDDFPGDDP